MSKKRKTKEILLEFSSGLNYPSWYDPARCGTLIYEVPKDSKTKLQEESNLSDHLIG